MTTPTFQDLYADALKMINQLRTENDQLKAQLRFIEDRVGHKPYQAAPLAQTIQFLVDERDKLQKVLQEKGSK